ncbi:dienelactone hydrolase family protein [Sphingomonas naphthae]|uniref:Dienelactone hydrolase family protein n=2 Tax=Sphingomonas naphthae TaxID=1813468 RepID=A0ABY7TRB5_9SPHN|nr:dienelactone hydrolase family protein [Sphingomonas naphthae]WCT75495.1 dienelactone hydrolase family protein [Sphingomonas naphthae]
MIEIDALDASGRFAAYLAEPEGAPRGAIIVHQEIFGVNPGIRAKCDYWASLGYLSIAPDMFWRFAPGYDVDPDQPEQMAEAFEVRKKFNPNKGVEDLEATIRVAREKSGGGKVGVVGYCLGGRMAYLSATRTDAAACVGYYGAGIDGLLEEAHAIANPLMLHFAEKDHFIPAETVAKIRAVLDPNQHVTIHEYAGVDHGFATTSGSRRDETAAQAADARTEAFFAAHIG